MKHWRLIAFLVFAICAFCVTAQAQKKWTYEGEDAASRITITITQQRNGYVVTGEAKPAFGSSCSIRGSYFPAGQRLRATCRNLEGNDYQVTGFKLAGKDAFQISLNFMEIVATRVGAKPTKPGASISSTEPASNRGCDGFAGTWKTSFGEMTFTITGNSATASYDFGVDAGTVRGTLLPDGRTLTGTYSEKEAKGTFRFTLSDDGQSFSGNWRRTSGKREPPSGTWEGKCVQR